MVKGNRQAQPSDVSLYVPACILALPCCLYAVLSCGTDRHSLRRVLARMDTFVPGHAVCWRVIPVIHTSVVLNCACAHPFQGVLSLPHLTGLALYSARFSLLSIQCPKLELLSIALESRKPYRELAQLTGLVSLISLHLCHIDEPLDLRTLAQL